MKYLIKVWLLTILLSPFLALFFLWATRSAKLSEITIIFPLWFFAIFFGALISLPALVLFYLLDRKLPSTLAPAKKKLVLACAGVLLVWITFLLIEEDIFHDFYLFMWPLAYSICVFVAAYFLSRELKKE